MKKKINIKENIWHKPKNITRYKADYDIGLSHKQVERRIADGLTNKSKNKSSNTYWHIIAKNFFTFFNILLAAIGVILLSFQLYSSCVFLVILLLNLGIGLVQDIRSKRLLDKLSLLNKEKTLVIRDGIETNINPSELVLDDIVILRDGDQIPCDSIVVFGNCSVNEALVTGESLPLNKKPKDKILSGTYISHGRIFARINAIGDDNYIETLQQKSKDYKAPKSQMFVQLNALFKVIAVVVVIFGIVDIVQFSTINFAGRNPTFSELQTMILSLSGALISMIPSGMYLLTSTSLAAGAISLANKKVLCQDVYSIETLARIDTLCIDKTGTITDGTMSVYTYEVIDTQFVKNPLFKTIMKSYNWAINENNFTGVALKEKFGLKNVFDSSEVIPFNSVNKYSATTLEKVGTICVGAFGYVPLIDNDKINKKVEDYSKMGYRVLVVGFSKDSIKNQKLPAKMTCLGLIVIQDQIRKNAKEILGWFGNNDVDIKVISGDNPLTVSEVAKIVGLKNADKYISLENVPIKKIPDLVDKYNVFGRVSPEQKEAIVLALKEKKHVVGMFGDGINDVLSLKQANVSITVNSASNACKDICNLMLIDDDFGKLPEIVAQGRRVINNLQRTCSLFLTKTIFSILLNLFFIIFGTITYANNPGAGAESFLWPFSPNNFYAWELFTIGLSAFFLALEPNNERIKGNFLYNIFKEAGPNGAIISIIIMFFYMFVYFFGAKTGLFINSPSNYLSTICVYFMSIASVFVLLQVAFKLNLYRSIVFGGSVLLSFGLFMRSIFSESEATNWLKLFGTTAPRTLDTVGIVTIIVMVSTCALIMGTIFFFNYRNTKGKYKQKETEIKGEIENEEHGKSSAR